MPRTSAKRPTPLWAGTTIAVAIVVAERAITMATGRPDSLVVAISLAAVATVVCAIWGRRAARPLRAAVILSTSLALAAVVVMLVVGIPGRLSAVERQGLELGLAAAAGGAGLALVLSPRISRFASRVVHGERGDPDALVTAWWQRVTRGLPEEELTLQLAEALTAALVPRAVEIWTGIDGWLRLAASVPARTATDLRLSPEATAGAGRAGVLGRGWAEMWAPELLAGRADGGLRLSPVSHASSLLGLVVVERDEEEPFTANEDRLLADAARRLALALRNSALNSALVASLDELRLQAAELEASRRRVVKAADEAARRIERNLHDGAQQNLVTLAVKLSIARNLLRSDPESVDPLLADLQADVAATLDELRTLAQGIYPPVLVERGLEQALRAAAERSPLPVDVEVSVPDRPPSEVEAATYFCCLEALQNAAKHAGERAKVHVSVAQRDHSIWFSVVDDGAGFDLSTKTPSGGLVQLSDRVGALGGTISVRSRPGRGTDVTGSIPLSTDV